MQNRNQIFFLPKDKSDNLGDWLILRELLLRLTRYGPVTCRDPRLRAYGIRNTAFSKNGALFFARLIGAGVASKFNGRRIYIITGPGHRFSPPPSLKSRLGTFGKIMAFLVFRGASVRICSFGVSLGPFSKWDVVAEKITSALTHYYSVRDHRSQAYIRSLGIAKVDFFCDLSLLAEMPEPSKKNKVSVSSFREKLFGRQKNDAYRSDELSPVLKSLLHSLSGAGVGEHFFAYQVDEDRSFCKFLADSLKEENVRLKEPALDWAAAKDIYSSAEIVLSNRLHVLLLGLKMKCLPVALIDRARHDKIAGFFEDADIQDLILDTKSDTIGSDRLLSLYGRKDFYLLKIQSYVHSQSSRAVEILDRIFLG